MKKKLTKTATIITIAFAFLSAISICTAQDYNTSYQLLNRPDGNLVYELNIVIPQSLLEYYKQESHRLSTDSDFAKFVTPYALKPIADNLWKIYDNNEDFTNGALMIVHQLTYEETVPAKYPVETMADNKGDCDLFSCTAASILKAGGIDIVLLHYKDQKHMNIGVHLSNAPRRARTSAYSITQNGVTYYIAECTSGSDWKDSWRVGECPDDMKQASAQVITLENAEQVTPGQVSASFTAIEPSSISLEISPPLTFQQSIITCRGQLNPIKPNANVTIYMEVDGSWTVLGTAVTQSDGRFEYAWKMENAGLCSVRASWSGDESNAGTTSLTKSATVVPLFLVALLAVVVLAAVIGAVAVVASRHTQHESLEPKIPQPPGFS
jgi:hypothetical protein